MSMTLESLEPGTDVWILATGWWRRGLVVATLRRKVIIRYQLAGGGTRDTRIHPDTIALQPRGTDVVAIVKAAAAWDRRTSDDTDVPPWADRPIAKRGCW